MVALFCQSIILVLSHTQRTNFKLHLYHPCSKGGDSITSKVSVTVKVIPVVSVSPLSVSVTEGKEQ